MKRRYFVLAVAVVLAACGSSGSTSETAVPAPTGADASVDAPSPSTSSGGSSGSGGFDAAPPPSVACAGKLIPPRDQTLSLDFGGDTRTFDVHVPDTYDPKVPMPLIVNFHGFTSNAPEEELLSNMNGKADSVGFIVAYPEGLGTAQSWNAGACCGQAAQENKDDVGLVGKILDMVEDRFCVDQKRVFATGMSNGGFMSHRLACELSTRIAAVAPVAGVLGITTCNPARPVPVMHFHGTLDPLVPYDGSPTLGFISVPDTFSGWAKRENCTGDPVETYRKADSHCSTYQKCAQGSEVTLCTVDGGGHTWPGGLPVPTLGYTTTNLNATDAMWDFFVMHPMP